MILDASRTIDYTPSERELYEEELKAKRDQDTLHFINKEEGMAIGQAIGESRGETKGKIELLVQLLTHRYADQVPVGVMDKLAGISDLARINQLFDKALKCQTIGEFEAELNK